MSQRSALGPVFAYEWLTRSRRWQAYAIRAGTQLNCTGGELTTENIDAAISVGLLTTGVLETVTDYLLVTTDGTAADADSGDPAGTEGAAGLAAGLTLEVLDSGLSRRLMRACELRGERWDPERQFGVAQAFVHIVDPLVAVDRQQLHAWDPDQTLFSALALW